MRTLVWLAVILGGPAVAIGNTVAMDGSRSVWDGVYTEDQAGSGKEIFTRSCAGCHGFSLEGGEQAPPLVGGGFLSNWNDLSAGDLMERLRLTMPLNDPGSLPRNDYVDVLAYIFKFNQFPAGPAKLDRRTEVLKSVRISATNPRD